MKRNLTLSEKKIVQSSMPSLNLENWLITKKLPYEVHLKHKVTGTKRIVPVAN